MKNYPKLTKIALVGLFVAGVLALPRCNSESKPTENSSDAAANKMMSEPAPKGNPVERGRYLVTIGLCNDCHSPKIFTRTGPIADTTRLLSGHPADGVLPKLNPKDIRPDNWVLGGPDFTTWVGMFGISFTANLTPDSTTGLGAWTPEIFRNAMRTGKHMGVATGRDLLPPMPWNYIGQMTDDDLNAVFAYLHSLKPIVNKVPVPISPSDMAKM